MDKLKSLECKKGEITSEFVRLNELEESLHNRIGILFDRLQDLLRKPEPKTNECEPPKQLLQSQFAVDLSSLSSTIETDLDKINEILNRLEL